jgi:hypothetical protein
MAELADVLTKILERFKANRDLYEKNEEAVRQQLVNPTLRGLGWDPEDPSQVKPNLSSEEGFPDYTLLKGGKPFWVLEVKNASIDVVDNADAIRQVGKYAFGEGIRYCALTNGLVWVLFRSFEEGKPISERVIWSTDLEQDKLTAAERRLLDISLSRIADLEVRVKKTEALDGAWESLTQTPDDVSRALLSAMRARVSGGVGVGLTYTDDEIEDMLRERVRALLSPSIDQIEPDGEQGPPTSPIGDPPITQMQIQDKRWGIQNGYEVLVNTAEFLIARGKLKAADCPISAGYKRYLVNTEAKHRYGEFRGARKLSNGLYVETAYSNKVGWEKARKLLERFGFSRDSLKLG